MAKLQTCAGCGHQQDLPAIFCGACSSPLIQISKLLLTSVLTVTISAYVLFGLYAEKLTWPAPLYALYVFLFIVFSYAITRRHPVITTRMLLWSLLLVYAMWFFWLSLGTGVRMLTSDIRDILELIEANPISQWTVTAVGFLCLIAAFFALYRRFGLTLAYRVALTLFAGFAFLLRWMFAYSIGETGAPVSPRLSDWFTWAPETTVKELLELIAVNTVRVVIAEMAVYSFVKSYKPAMEHYRRVATLAPPETGHPVGAGGAFADAITRLSNGVLRAAIMMQHFVLAFARTFAHYLWGVYRVARRIFIDLLVPLTALGATAFLLGMISEHTAAYILGEPQGKLLYLGPIRKPWQIIPILFALVFAAQMIFLAAITKFPWRSLMRCNFLLVLWIAPFFFAFFVFVSLSLVATGTVLRRWDTDFPFRIGPMTIVASGILVLLVVYAVMHNLRRRRIRQPEGVEQPMPVTAEVSAMSQEPPQGA
jgi:hypothetical protein